MLDYRLETDDYQASPRARSTPKEVTHPSVNVNVNDNVNDNVNVTITRYGFINLC